MDKWPVEWFILGGGGGGTSGHFIYDDITSGRL